MKIDEALADPGGRRAALERDQREISRRIAELEASIARAVASRAPSDGVAQAYQDLRALKAEQADIAAALGRAAGTASLIVTNHPLGGDRHMSDELTTDARLKEAVKAIAKELEQRGVLREPALEMAKRHAERIFISPNGSIRVASRAGSFYPENAERPFAHLTEELYHAAPAADKTAPGVEDQLAAKQRLKRTGAY